MTIILLVAVVLIVLGAFLLEYIDATFNNSYGCEEAIRLHRDYWIFADHIFCFLPIHTNNKPLMYMKKAADLISKGDYSMRVPVDSSDEIGQLSNTMNFMAEKLEGTFMI